MESLQGELGGDLLPPEVASYTTAGSRAGGSAPPLPVLLPLKLPTASYFDFSH